MTLANNKVVQVQAPGKSPGNNGHLSGITLRYASKVGIFFQADCLHLLAGIEDDAVDLVFVDPPFNLGKEYENGVFDDAMETEVYRNWCHEWLLELVRVLRPGGALFLYHWPFWLMQLGAWLNTLPPLQYKSWIALKMKSGFPIRGRLHPAHYGLLYFVKKGAKPTFNVVRHRTPVCRHCGRLVRDYGGYRKKFEKFEDETGIPWIQISDFWEDTRPARQDKCRKNTINELPLHIPERVMLLASRPGDIVLDVFGGGGSTYQAAEMYGRRWIGCELTDPNPAVRRLVASSREEVRLPGKELLRCFKPEFLKAHVSDVKYKNLAALLALVRPPDNRPAPGEDSALKSKILGF